MMVFGILSRRFWSAFVPWVSIGFPLRILSMLDAFINKKSLEEDQVPLNLIFSPSLEET